jgi:hypothetical protein
MKLTKENVCVFIENEAQLEEARQLLEKYGEDLATFEYAFDLIYHDLRYPYLRLHDFRKDWFLSNRIHWNQTQITIRQLEEILKEEK